jgi:YHS domain-containing protein
MGEPVVRVYGGREVRFCCDHCLPRFEKDLEASWRKIDEKMIEDQKPWYPLETCPVSGRPAGEKARELVHNNRLVRFCCERCPAAFAADPGKYLEALDKAAIEKQGAGYPLSVCVVSGHEYGAEGERVDVVVGGRLIRLCCADCEASIRENPGAFIEKLDKAWEAARARPAEPEPSIAGS